MSMTPATYLRGHREDMSEDEFKREMCAHMAEQTKFLSSIYDVLNSVNMLFKVISIVVSAYGAWTVFNTLIKH